MTPGAAGWPEVALGAICELRYGRSLPANQRAPGGITVYGANGAVGTHDAALTSGAAIIVGRKGSVGEVHFSPAPCWPIDTAYYIDASCTRAELRWLTYGLRTLGLAALNKAAAIPGLSREDAYRKKLLLPPLSEQLRIADLLDAVTAQRDRRAAAVAELDALAESVFLALFGDPATNPKSWAQEPLSALVTKLTDGEHRNPTFTADGMPLVMAGNVLDDALDLASARRVRWVHGRKFRAKCDPEKGDLLLVSRGATVGRLCQVRVAEELCLMGSVILIKPDPVRVDGRYLGALLKLPIMQRRLGAASGASAQRAIYLKDLKPLRCPVPPLSLQEEFARQADAIAAQRAAHRAARDELDALLASLQHRAFRGELGPPQGRRGHSLRAGTKDDAEDHAQAPVAFSDPI